MTTAEAVNHLREISCETAEMRAKIADLLEAKDAECKAWREYETARDSKVVCPSGGAECGCLTFTQWNNVQNARRRCDELENP
jgi:hypothetical protein